MPSTKRKFIRPVQQSFFTLLQRSHSQQLMSLETMQWLRSLRSKSSHHDWNVNRIDVKLKLLTVLSVHPLAHIMWGHMQWHGLHWTVSSALVRSQDQWSVYYVLVSIWLLSLIKDKSLIKDSLEGMPKMDFPQLSWKTTITVVFSIFSNPVAHDSFL